MELPLISIITPSFNQAKWLESTIQSVLAQTYKNIEYIIIDGGSTDGSKQIIEKYSHQLKYWQSQPDQGQANALNIGFKHCKGVLVAYLNADDLLEPNAVEGILNAYSVNQGYSIYYGKCKTIDENGILLHEAEGSQIRYQEVVKNGMLPNIFQPACFFNVVFLFREKFVDENYKFAFDFELILHLLSTRLVFFLNRDIASYRVHNGSKSNLFKVDAFKEKLTIQEKYSKKDFLLFKWRRIKLAIAQKIGKISNG